MKTEPTETEINRGIAEWMGWIIIEDGDHSFTTSHDACHEVLERMTDYQLDDYSYELYKLVDPDGSILNVNALMVKATAHQKALAIYRVIKGES